MAIETMPGPSIPISSPFRPGLGFLTATPIISAAPICLALVTLSAILAPGLAPHDPVLLHHALRNAAVPVITVIGTGFAILISGVVVTESVFNLPGIGRLTVDAVLARDYPVIQAMILLTSLVYVTVNLLIDVAYTLLDPRIRY